LYISVQACKFSSNEYRFFPLAFEDNLCNILDARLFGLENLYSCGNLFRCPMKK
ncbi:hypothetical protein ILUMI_17918, partial [Ignelater luminosus]